MSFVEGGLSIDDFSDLKEIGKGKDSKIYSALCPKLGADTVVIKVYERSKISPIKLRSVKREARMMAFLTQKGIPAITSFIAAFMDDSNMYIVMEHCSGGDLLEQLLREGRAMREKRVAQEVVYPLLSTLKGMHELGVIHRDIKLENIFIDSARRIMLGDFGLTMSMYEERAISPVGTLEYMAPETVQLPPADLIISGTIKAEDVEGVNEKVDIWALGVTVYELVTGRSPFEGEDKAAVKAAIIQGKMRSMPSFLSPECGDFITSMMSYDPDERAAAAKLLEHPWIRRNAVAVPLIKAAPHCPCSFSSCSALSFSSGPGGDSGTLSAGPASPSPGSSAASWGLLQQPQQQQHGSLARKSFAYADRVDSVKRATTSPSPLGSGARSPLGSPGPSSMLGCAGELPWPPPGAPVKPPPMGPSPGTGGIPGVPPSIPTMCHSWSPTPTTPHFNPGMGDGPSRGESWEDTPAATPTCRGGSDLTWQSAAAFHPGSGLPPSPFAHCSASAGELLAGFHMPSAYSHSSHHSSPGAPATPYSSSPCATPLRLSRGTCHSVPIPGMPPLSCHRFFEQGSSFHHLPSNCSDPGHGAFHHTANSADGFHAGFRTAAYRSDSIHGGTRRASRRTDSLNGAPHTLPNNSESNGGSTFRIRAHGSGAQRSSSSFTRVREDLKRAASQVIAVGAAAAGSTAAAVSKVPSATGSLGQMAAAGNLGQQSCYSRQPPAAPGVVSGRHGHAAVPPAAAAGGHATAASLFERMSSFFSKRLMRRRRSGGDAPGALHGMASSAFRSGRRAEPMMVDTATPQSPMRSDSSMSEQSAPMGTQWMPASPDATV